MKIPVLYCQQLTLLDVLLVAADPTVPDDTDREHVDAEVLCTAIRRFAAQLDQRQRRDHVSDLEWLAQHFHAQRAAEEEDETRAQAAQEEADGRLERHGKDT